MTSKDYLSIYIELWKSENPIKTNKLLMYFVVTSILVVALDIKSPIGWLVPALGAGFSFIWLFCIGRTVAYQDFWQRKIMQCLREEQSDGASQYVLFPTTEEKAEMPFYGKLPGRYALLWPPIIGCIIWFAILCIYFGGNYAFLVIDGTSSVGN